MPQKIGFEIDEGLLSIEFDSSSSWPGISNNYKFQLTETASLVFEPKQGVSFENVVLFHRMFEELMILFTDSECTLHWPKIAKEDNEFFDFYYLRMTSPSNDIKRNNCPIVFHDIQNSLGQMVSTWMKKRQEFGSGFYLYLGTRRRKVIYTEHKFVNLIWGIEAFDRRKNPVPISDTKANDKIQRIIGTIEDKKDRKWLVSKLKYAKEPNLEKRIFETLKSLELDFDNKKLAKFAKACADRRNEISHFGGPQTSVQYSKFIVDLEQKSKALSYLYHALLLKEVGVDLTHIQKWLFKSIRSYQIKQAFSIVGLLHESNHNEM